MDKTLFELVPVSVKPEKDDWYWVQHDSVPGFPSTALFRDNKWWDIGDEDPDYFETYPSHYLRPLPPPVAEERTQGHRCGWCGNICDKDGNNIEVPEGTTGYDKATDIQGKCCNHEVWDDAFTNAPLRIAQRTEDWLKERYYITKK